VIPAIDMSLPEQLGLDAATQFVEVVVPNDLRAVKNPEEQILRALQRSGYSEEVIFAIKLSLEEALTNGVKHGNCGDPTKKLTVCFSITPQRAVIMIRDEGCGFRPCEIPDPTAEENLERPSGRGIMLMNHYMTRVCYNGAGNEVWLLKENTP
jgi:serine/threonine-protein kinase RsbW